MRRRRISKRSSWIARGRSASFRTRARSASGCAAGGCTHLSVDHGRRRRQPSEVRRAWTSRMRAPSTRRSAGIIHRPATSSRGRRRIRRRCSRPCARRCAISTRRCRSPIRATMDELVARSLERPRSLSMLVGGFAIVALLLSAIGIYGVMAYYVQQHTKDISIRLALGGSPRDVLRLVVGQGMQVVATGVVVGSAGRVRGDAADVDAALRRRRHRRLRPLPRPARSCWPCAARLLRSREARHGASAGGGAAE